MAYLERAITPVLQKRLVNSKCLLLTGARQTGKSTLLKHIFPDYNYVTLDDKLTRLQAREDPKLFFLNHRRPLFIDEVQKEPPLLEEIKILVDESDLRGQFVMSGSQKLELMKGMSESLAGRVSIADLGTLSLREIKQISFNRRFVPTQDYLDEREKELVPYERIWESIHRGLYPELYDAPKEWWDFYSAYVSTYIERDINELVASDSVVFTRFLTAVAARSGELLNYSNIAGDVGVSVSTVKTWISVLERTGIIWLLQPYSTGVLSRALNTPKIYFRDTGLACFLTRWRNPEALQYSAVAGSMFETFVVGEFLKSYSNEGMDHRFGVFFYRGRNNVGRGHNEIDLVIEENGVLYPVEIKLSASPRAEMASAFLALDGIAGKKRGMGVIFCLTDRKHYLRDNLLALPLSYL
ncbi:MAG: ATP-binding protein [Succinivibrio sp.]|nr:ATP-binding protein [Succinivibrio sp.]